MKLIFLFASIYLIFLNVQSKKKYFHFLRKHTIYSDINKIFSQELKNPVILNGIKTSYKKTLCLSYCNANAIFFNICSFEHFIQNLPHLKYENSMIYVKDFLIGNGRVLNLYEENILKCIPKTSNAIILSGISSSILSIEPA